MIKALDAIPGQMCRIGLAASRKTNICEKTAEDTVAWTADIPGSGSRYLTISTLGDTEKAIHLPWKSVGVVASKVRVLDLWMHKDLGSSDTITLSLRPHASVLLKLTAQ